MKESQGAVCFLCDGVYIYIYYTLLIETRNRMKLRFLEFSFHILILLSVEKASLSPLLSLCRLCCEMDVYHVNQL